MKPKEILELEKFYGIELKQVILYNDFLVINEKNTFYIDEFEKLIGLNLNSNDIIDLEILNKYKELKILYLENNQISDIKSICNLLNLEILYLSNNNISDLTYIYQLVKLESLILSKNNIKDIVPIYSLENLETLYINYNNIYNISKIFKLKKLLILDLSFNKISDLTPLYHLKGLIFLNLSNNNIKNISNLISLVKLEYLNLNNNKINEIIILNFLINLNTLLLRNNFIYEINSIKDLVNLNKLDLRNNLFKEIYVLNNFKKLESLDLSKNTITNYNPIQNLKKLKYLDLSKCEISDISPIYKLTNLIELNLFDNILNEIEIIKNFKKLEVLYLSKNKIKDICSLENLRNLKYLSLRDNLIENLNCLKNLKNLTTLKLYNNKINDINELSIILTLPKLKNLLVHNNPFLLNTELIFNNEFSHLIELKSYLLRQLEENKQTIILPAKVLFLGNHASGKSTFLDYFINEDEQKNINNQKSTHILQIQQYKKEDKNHNLPNAIIFDFGGQDYYHGIYKAFLTNNAINLLFFKTALDKNQKVLDREDNTKQTYTFSREYWIHQLKYYHQEDNKTISLIQTHADTDTRCTYQNSRSSIHIDHEFFVGLNNDALYKKSNQLSLDYLVAILNEKIEENRKEIEEPQWYINFLNYIANYSIASSINISEVKEHYKREKVDESLFISDLKQLCEQGLILFYPEIESIKHIAWLNPSATILHIHNEVLTKELLLNNNGIIKKENFEEKVNKDIIELLKVHKVIFLDETNKDNPEYIIPGYLKNANEQKEEYFMLSDFDDPSFVLKFEYFIPFGFMNQLICKYGANPDKKLYWKDQLLFTYENKARILIQLNFEELEIKVFIKFKKNPKNENNTLENKILKDIIDIYYDRKPEKQIEIDNDNEDNTDSKKLRNVENIIDYRIPDDLYFSLDNLYFVHFITLNDESITTSEILGYQKNKDGKLDKSNGKTLSSIIFKKFTFNKNIQNMKKIFISYSKFDDDYKIEFVKHLITLKDEGLIDPFNCDEINLGDNSHEVIQTKLAECDYMFALVSVDFLNTPYIRNFEVDKAEELGKKIIPIIIKPCDWENSKLGKYHATLRGTNISLDKELFLNNKIKESTPIERAAFWTKIIKEIRAKLF